MQFNIENSKVPRCQHVKADGIQCNNPALKTARFCYYHAQIQRSIRPPHTPTDIALDSIAAITIALTNVTNRINPGAMDPVEARLMLRAIHNATIVLKLKSTLPAEEAPAEPITDPAKLEPHVVVLSPGQSRRASEGRALFDLAKSLARTHQQRTEQSAPPRFESSDTGPSLYTLFPSEYDDDEPASDLDRLPPHEFDREIERRQSEIDNSIPEPTDEEPLSCVLVDQPDEPCQYLKLDPRIFNCPVNKARDGFKSYILPDLPPFLADPKRCELLNFIALDQQESGYTLDGGVRDGMSRPLANRPRRAPEPDPCWRERMREAHGPSAVSDTDDPDVAEADDDDVSPSDVCDTTDQQSPSDVCVD